MMFNRTLIYTIFMAKKFKKLKKIKKKLNKVLTNFLNVV